MNTEKEMPEIDESINDVNLNIVPHRDRVIIAIPVINPKTPSGLWKSDNQVKEEQENMNKRPHKILAAGSQIKENGYDKGDYIYINGSFRPVMVPMNGTEYPSFEGFAIIGKVDNVALYEKELAKSKEEIEAKFKDVHKVGKQEDKSKSNITIVKN